MQGGAPSSPGHLPYPRADIPSQSRRLYTIPPSHPQTHIQPSVLSFPSPNPWGPSPTPLVCLSLPPGPPAYPSSTHTDSPRRYF